TAGDILWPAPERIDVGPIANYGYEGEVLLLTEIRVPAQASGEATLKARADWLVCREVCIPDGADLALTLPVKAGSGSDPQWAETMAKARAELPLPLRGWEVTAARSGTKVTVDLTASGPRRISQLEFFPFEDGKIEPSAKQTVTPLERGVRLQLETAK